MDGQLPSASHPVTVWGEPHDLWRGLSPRVAIVSFECFTPEKIANVLFFLLLTVLEGFQREMCGHISTHWSTSGFHQNFILYLKSSWRCKIPLFSSGNSRKWKCNSCQCNTYTLL